MQLSKRLCQQSLQNLKVYNFQYSLAALILTACGSGKSSNKSIEPITGFPSSYEPPEENYIPPLSADPNFKIFAPKYSDPYWINALVMADGDTVIRDLLSLNEKSVFFNFPDEKPNYIPVSILGWAPPNEEIIFASREIFLRLEQILNVKFQEITDNQNLGVISISQSIQSTTAGLSYYPNKFYELGSDVFISKAYSSPNFISEQLTNYDYEVLVHEIGHALGLKHPFENDGDNFTILSVYEDKTNNTAMSYDDYSFTFDGTYRALDWMALTKLYGVNPLYEGSENLYKFDNQKGVFIIDGGGVDIIQCKTSYEDIFIDLRPGTHSYEGEKSNFITLPRQLTISHGSEIENVETGHGNDVVIGNDLSNIIMTGSGDDTIFAGVGLDIVYPGSGANLVDFSEEVNSQDILILEKTDNVPSSNTVYGFKQGPSGDVVRLSILDQQELILLPLVDALTVPVGLIDNCLVRIFGDGLYDPNDLERYFSDSGLLKNLKLSEGGSGLLITSNTQDTGASQTMFMVNNNFGDVEVHTLAVFIGNYIDIDNWSTENFIV